MLSSPRLHSSAAEGAPSSLCPPLLVHSHLRWDWVWQRPQQFLSRLAKKRPVLFVEEPARVAGLPEPRAVAHPAEGHPNVTILRTELPEEWFVDRSRLDVAQGRLVRDFIASSAGKTWQRPVQWFYDPMAAEEFAGRMNERAIVYDCMDQLSQFRGAPPELLRREARLLHMAEVVFAGGPKIHAAKREENPNCHCFGCGVETEHFERALDPATVVPPELAALPAPRLGFFGVVDERMDYQLLARLADAHPEWSVVIVGPPCKVDPANFPQRSNLHFVGGKPYAELPAWVKGFDVCLMPFAINEATEFINPTKALEYFATGRPVVSTAIEDVILQFSHVAYIAHSRDAFVQVCERALAEPNPARLEAGRALARENAWEAAVDRMEALLEAALRARQLLAPLLASAFDGRDAIVLDDLTPVASAPPVAV